MSRIVSVVALVALLAAGCGGAARPHGVALRGLPQTLARGWEAQASEIGAAASAGDDCRAMRLARALRDQVVSMERKVPVRLQSALLTGVNALAARTTCTPPVVKKPPRPPKGPGGHEDHGHKDHHGHRGGGNDR